MLINLNAGEGVGIKRFQSSSTTLSLELSIPCPSLVAYHYPLLSCSSKLYMSFQKKIRSNCSFYPFFLIIQFFGYIWSINRTEINGDVPDLSYSHESTAVWTNLFKTWNFFLTFNSLDSSTRELVYPFHSTEIRAHHQRLTQSRRPFSM